MYNQAFSLTESREENLDRRKAIFEMCICKVRKVCPEHNVEHFCLTLKDHRQTACPCCFDHTDLYLEDRYSEKKIEQILFGIDMAYYWEWNGILKLTYYRNSQELNHCII